MGEQAIDEYKKVLQMDPKNTNSMKGIAYLYLKMKKFTWPRSLQEGLGVDPNDPEPYYSVAVIDWTQTYPPRARQARAGLAMKPDERLPTKDKKVCDETEGERNRPWSGGHREPEQGFASFVPTTTTPWPT